MPYVVLLNGGFALNNNAPAAHTPHSRLTLLGVGSLLPMLVMLLGG